MIEQAIQKLNTYHRRWQQLQWLECFGYATAAGVVLMSLGFLIFDWSIVNVLLGSLALGLMGSWLLFRKHVVRKTGKQELVRLLNRKYLRLEESADLLLVPVEKLSGLAVLQQEQVARTFVNMEEPIRLKHHLPRALSILFLSVLLGTSLWAFRPNKLKIDAASTIVPSAKSKIASDQDLAKAIPAKIENLVANVKPPGYTRLSEFSTEKLDLEIPWSSTVTWKIQFNTAIEKASLVLNGKDKVALRALPPRGAKQKNNTYYASAKLLQSGFYFIEYQGIGQEVKTSDYFRITVIEDQPPAIVIKGLENFSSYSHDSLPDINFQTLLTDDYGTSDAYLIATLSRGKGESVKFREDTLRYNNTFTKVKKNYKLPFSLSLNAVVNDTERPASEELKGMINVEPGDELYLHFEAIDNKPTTPQLSKTHKYIIAIKDTSSVVSSAFGALGVNRIPEYFRSQRQIIIDTEKLITERSSLDDATFQTRSNNIGIDQKLLRLRYGKFLGEEFETVIGQSDAIGAIDEHDHEEGEEHDHTEDFQHDHDDHEGHDHGGASTEQIDKAVDPFAAEVDTMLEGYAHFHDMTEQATFYDETTSAKLRAALAEMWNAELHLRMGEPEKALPFENKALLLIKAIQQASRIYVARVGFEPPTINVASTRFTGELDKVRNVKNNKDTRTEALYENIVLAMPLVEQLMEANALPDVEGKKRLKAAAQELAATALNEPGPYLQALQQLRLLVDTEVPFALRRLYYQNIRMAFTKLVEQEEQSPVYQLQRQGRLSGEFMKAISSE